MRYKIQFNDVTDDLVNSLVNLFQSDEIFKVSEIEIIDIPKLTKHIDNDALIIQFYHTFIKKIYIDGSFTQIITSKKSWLYDNFFTKNNKYVLEKNELDTKDEDLYILNQNLGFTDLNFNDLKYIINLCLHRIIWMKLDSQHSNYMHFAYDNIIYFSSVKPLKELQLNFLKLNIEIIEAQSWFND